MNKIILFVIVLVVIVGGILIFYLPNQNDTPSTPHNRILGEILTSIEAISSYISQQTWITPALAQVYQIPEGDTIQYENTEFGFRIMLPARWSNFRVIQGGNFVAFGLKNSILASHNINEGYGNPLVITIFPKETWENMTTTKDIISQFIKITEDEQGNVFSYFLGNDDEGYDGFPSITPGEIYHGPFYDAEHTIVPSLELL